VVLTPSEYLIELDDWIREHVEEIEQCPATARGYRKAASLNWGLQRLREFRERFVAAQQIP